MSPLTLLVALVSLWLTTLGWTIRGFRSVTPEVRTMDDQFGARWRKWASLLGEPKLVWAWVLALALALNALAGPPDGVWRAFGALAGAVGWALVSFGLGVIVARAGRTESDRRADRHDRAVVVTVVVAAVVGLALLGLWMWLGSV